MTMKASPFRPIHTQIEAFAMTASATHSLWTPFLISPRFSTRPWGVNSLQPWYNQQAEGEPIGEAWLTGDDSLIASGAFSGQSLGSLFAAHPVQMLGNDQHPGSPLLIKLIFASQKLSVQVHPDDAMAQKYGDLRGKTECWYLLSSEPGAQLAVGLKNGVTLDKVREGIKNDNLEESLNLIHVSAGEMIFVDAGTVHAIWPGVVVLETQQNCDLTYRMYDYGRPRELHIEKSLEATRFNTQAGKVVAEELGDRSRLINSDYFRCDRMAVSGSRTSPSLLASDEAQPGLSYLFTLSGQGRIVSSNGSFEPLTLKPGVLAAIPAASCEFVLEGELEVVRITPSWPQEG